jgi:hypothetical protein
MVDHPAGIGQQVVRQVGEALGRSVFGCQAILAPRFLLLYNTTEDIW